MILGYVVGGRYHDGGLAGNAFVGVWVDVGDDGCLPEGMGSFVGLWVDFGDGGYFPEGMGGVGELQEAAG